MLTPAQTQLWDRINGFQLDDPHAEFKFSERLARENGWSMRYTHRVIAEYKKFLFLCYVAERGVTPADAVDQAWHLHLTFTRSYWIDLCRDTIGREIHHNPTRGGGSEAVKYHHFYTDTARLYADHFGEMPPVDIWPDHDTRFGKINFQRVSLDNYWLIRKPKHARALALSLALILLGWVFIQASDNYIFVLVFTAVLVVIMIFSYREEGRGGDKRDGDGGDSGCSTAGCGGDADSGHHGHSGHGCHSGGHSGCSSHSGCSGCSGCSSSGCSSGH
ncbi:hypothetical protein LX99_04955 [Mucilaginibacter oryzae]|uniref:TIGR04222 domain-containing membrane protein n=1 Tax=Mucilaginibacter oryzae TaxID=468058 RepID=A0A316GW58_9SPHI|nr:hypothetical protein [Mucilaginibacter oryzae]PWK67097.1 hypothetical protein LX99_04955 [Mucilaginibacter oryzae]